LDVVATSRGEGHQRRESQRFSQNFILLKALLPDSWLPLESQMQSIDLATKFKSKKVRPLLYIAFVDAFTSDQTQYIKDRRV